MWNKLKGGRGIIGEGPSRSTYKRPMDKAKGGRIEGGRWEWVELGKVVVGKWRQLSLNNNKKKDWMP